MMQTSTLHVGILLEILFLSFFSWFRRWTVSSNSLLLIFFTVASFLCFFFIILHCNYTGSITCGLSAKNLWGPPSIISTHSVRARCIQARVVYNIQHNLIRSLLRSKVLGILTSWRGLLLMITAKKYILVGFWNSDQLFLPKSIVAY